jgi:phosphatidylinositol phospholipase C delta
MINHAMFQRNGRSGYVLKPLAIRLSQKKDLLATRTLHSFEVTIISAQQLPRPRDASGLEVLDKGIVDPYVEVTLYVPDWPVHVVGDGKEKDKGKKKMQETGDGDGQDVAGHADGDTTKPPGLLPPPLLGTSSTPARSISSRTSVVKKNGFNPVWEENLSIPFDCVGDMMDLVFVRFVVRQEDKDGEEPLAVYCASLGSLQCGTHCLFFLFFLLRWSFLTFVPQLFFLKKKGIVICLCMILSYRNTFFQHFLSR